MEYIIRNIQESEYDLLGDFLYEAIYIPDGEKRPSKDIINMPELQVYLRDFGKSKDDFGMVAVADGKVIGAVWARVMNDYGHIDDDTPSLALAIHDGYRGRGIGTALMQSVMDRLREAGYGCVSLSVQKSNPALHLYERLGFERVGTVIGETEEEIVMRHLL